MKKLALNLVLLLFMNYLHSQSNEQELFRSRIDRIEQSLTIKIPDDLRSLWMDSAFRKVNTSFLYRNFKEMQFVFPENITNETLTRDVSSVIEEKNGLYFLRKEGSITEDESREIGRRFEKDLVMLSKFYPMDYDFKALVFASCTWFEGFTNMFYRFDDDGNCMGIYILQQEQSSEKPIYIGADLENVFGSLDQLRKGFPEYPGAESFWQKYSEKEKEKPEPEDFVYGIFPQKALCEVAFDIVPDMVLFNSGDMEYLTEEERVKIKAVYKLQGKDIEFPEMSEELGYNDSYAYPFLQKINNEPFNDGKDKRIFIITSDAFGSKAGLVRCTAEQARILDSYNFIQFNWRERSLKEVSFMYGE